MIGTFPSIGRQVALKVLPAHLSTQPAFQARFRREALLIAGLQHTHIVPVFDYGQSTGRAYLVMPLLENGTIATRVRGRRLPVDEIVRVGTQVGDALAYAHARGMVPKSPPAWYPSLRATSARSPRLQLARANHPATMNCLSQESPD